MNAFFKKIQSQLVSLLICSILIPIFVLGGYSISVYSNALTDLYLQQTNNQGVQSTEKIVNFIQFFQKNLLFLSEVPPVQEIIRAREGGGIDRQQGSSYQIWVERLNGIFEATMKNNSAYMELRYLNEKGDEMVRLDADGTSITVSPPNKLENKSDQVFFQETSKLSLGEIYTSSLQLNKVRGAIATPYQPVIEYGMPIFDVAGQRKGMLMSKVSAQPLFDLIKSFHFNQTTEVMLVNQDGYYLYHKDPEKQWGFDLNHNETIFKDYQSDLASQLISLNQDVDGLTFNNSFFSSYGIPLSKNHNSYLKLIFQTDRNQITKPVDELKKINVFIVLITLAIVLPFALLQIRNLINRLKFLINNISNFSLDILTTLNQQETLLYHQSSTVNDTSNTLEDLGKFAQQTAQEAEKVAKNAQQSLTLADRGDNLVQETLKGLLSVQEKVAVISQQAQRLGSQTSQIGNITNLARVVSDLAKQTNMLALNASVEAVRAGEHGQGFGVVASEIRKLSDESRKAAENINAIVPELQGAIAATVQATQAGAKTLETGMNVAEQAAQAFSGVRQAANQVFISNQQMSFNAKKQAVALEALVHIMVDLNQKSAESVKAISYTKQGVETLNKQAESLKTIL
jgi:methyl-accepting chemotaxis protein